MTKNLEVITVHCHGEDEHPVEVQTVESVDKNCLDCGRIFDGMPDGEPELCMGCYRKHLAQAIPELIAAGVLKPVSLP